MRKNRGLYDFLSRFGLTRSRKRKSAPTSKPRLLHVEQLEERRLLTVMAPQTGLAASAGLVASAIPAVDMTQGATKIVSLLNDFREADASSSGLRYQVVADSNSSLFASPPLVAPPGLLLLRVAPDAIGMRQLDRRSHGPKRTGECRARGRRVGLRRQFVAGIDERLVARAVQRRIRLGGKRCRERSWPWMGPDDQHDCRQRGRRLRRL